MSKRKKEGIIVEGFCFFDEEEAEQAKREREAIKYMKARTNMDYPETVLQVYNKMIEEKLFETEVGYAYLKELQDYLKTMPFIKNEDIAAITVRHPKMEDGVRKERQRQRQREKAMEEKRKAQMRREEKRPGSEKYKLSLLFNLILAICIVLMFVISMTSKNPTILNYESNLVNKYAAWEQELTEREQAVREKEQELNLTEE